MIEKTKFNKNTVKESFSRASSTYDAYSSLQKKVAEELVKRNSSKLKGKTLDIGCGTGKVIEEVLKVTPNQDITGIDLSPQMAKEAEKKTGVNCIEGDFEALPFEDSTFDTIISSLTFQWTTPGVNGFLDTYRVLKPNGTFIFSTLGEETLKELKKSVSVTKKNYDNGSMDFEETMDIEEDLKNAGFNNIEIKKEKITNTYKSPWELFKTLKKIGATTPYHNNNGSLAKGLFLRAVAKYYQANSSSQEGGINATYDVIYVRATK